MDNQPAKHIDARLYFRILWKRKSLWLLPPVVILCTVAIGVNVVPPVYEAAATVYYDDRPNLTRQLQELTGMSGGNYARSDELAQQRTLDMLAKIRSRPFLENVVRTLRLNEDPQAIREGRKIHDKRGDVSAEEATMQMLVERLRMRLNVEPSGATVFRVVARDNYPQNAQLLAKWVSQMFVDNALRGQMQQIRAAGDFSQDQLAVYEKKLRTAEDALRTFQESMLGQQLASNPVGEKNRDQARTLVRQANEEAADLERQLARSPLLSSKGPAVVARSATLRALGEELNRAESDLGILLLDKSQPDQSVVAQKDRVGRTRQAIYDQLTGEVAARYPSMSPNDQNDLRDGLYAQLQLASIHARRDRLQKCLDDYDRNYRQAPREQLELDRLRQDVETNRNLLSAFRNQSTSSRISEAVESTSLGMKVEILETPVRPLDPVSPNKSRVFTFALLLGPLLGFAAVFAAEYLDSSYRTVEEIEGELGLPVLGTMPRPVEIKGSLGAKRNRWVPITVSAAVALTVVFFVLKFTVLPDLGVAKNSAIAHEPVLADTTSRH